MDTSYEYKAPQSNNLRVKNFYSVCVDNFFRNPDKFREWGLSLPKKSDPKGTWPGKRTKPLYEFDIQLHNELILKVFSAFMDLEYTNIKWQTAETMFQEIDTFDKPLHNRGWIHKDDDVDFAFIIYLTPNADKNSGTSLFDLKGKKSKALSMRKQYDKESLFLGKEVDEKEYEKSLLTHESFFTEKTRFYNVYNRMIAYDSNEFHRANNFVTNADKRLTLIGFIKGIEVDEMPLQRIRSAEVWDNNLENRISKL